MDWRLAGIVFAWVWGAYLLGYWLWDSCSKEIKAMGVLGGLAFLFFASAATASAQKTNSPPQTMSAPGSAALSLQAMSVQKGAALPAQARIAQPTDILPQHAPAKSQATPPPRSNGGQSLPGAEIMARNWNTRGAWRDSLWLGFAEGWTFPFGTNHLCGVEVFSHGEARPSFASPESVASIGTHVAIVPGLTAFSLGPTPSNSYLLAWSDAAEWRDTNSLIAASIELFRCGDIAVVTNGVASRLVRVHPSDLDGDGIVNAMDANPFVYDGDFFGPQDEMPPGANPANYCWVELVVSGADAEVVFAGDGASDLPDPHFMARAGAVYRVAILAGKRYEVEADEPIECVGMSDGMVEVTRTGPNSLEVWLPVTVEVSSSGAGAATFSVWPYSVQGAFEWTTNLCCNVTTNGWLLSWSCCGNCGCDGCGAEGWLVYEGYRIAVHGGVCGCEPPPPPPPPPAPPGVAVSFSEDALFYEESYMNAPGDEVGRRVSTNATLVCTVDGGGRGGSFCVRLDGAGCVEQVAGGNLPFSPVEIAPNETRSWSAQFAPVEHGASTNATTATVTFTENLSGETISASSSLAVIELELMPWVVRDGCENRHLWGVGEGVDCFACPDVGEWGETGAGEIDVDAGAYSYTCAITNDNSQLYYEFGCSRYYFDLTIVEPSAIVARSPMAEVFGVATNHAGGVGMFLDVYILPEEVSFSEIAVEEIPCYEGTHQGYFSNVAVSNVWYHTRDNGAGEWADVRSNNLWAFDEACVKTELPRETPNGQMTTNDMTIGSWSDGLLIWQIPLGWAASGTTNGPPVKTMAVQYTQTTQIDEFGTVVVSKLQNTVSRETNCVVRLNGNIVHESLLIQNTGEQND